MSGVEEAVGLLVKAVDYTRAVSELTRAVEHARKLASRYPSCFRALVDLGIKDRDKFEAILKQVDQERLNNPAMRRGDYQKLLMRKRRARFAKMTTIAQLQHPGMTASQIRAHVKAQNKVMNQERKAYIAEHADDEDFSFSEAVHTFWEAVDAGLDEQLAKLRKKI